MCLKRSIFLFLLYITSSTLSISQDVISLKNDKILKEAKSLYNKSVDFGRSGKLDSALYYSENAVKLYENAPKTDSTLLAYSYQNLGIINKLLGQYTEAIKLYNKAETIYISRKNIQLTAYIYGNKANIYFAQQNFTKALDYQLRAISVFKKD
jgi:tetratricopeptide (TPR) repeat protein